MEMEWKWNGINKEWNGMNGMNGTDGNPLLTRKEMNYKERHQTATAIKKAMSDGTQPLQTMPNTNKVAG